MSTPTAPPTPACRLKRYPVAEVNGFVFAWFDQTTREPRWRLPVVSEAGWTPTTTQRYRIRSHPQATTENTIDLDHLRFLHHFEAVRQVGESELDGPNFNTRFRFEGSYDIPLLRHLRFALSAAVSLCGLGFLFVETVAPSLAVRTMNWFLTTPIDGEHVDLLVSAKVPAMEHIDESTNSLDTRLLRLVPGRLRQTLIHPLVMYEFKKHIEKDFTIWDNKAYRERPLLSRADGELIKVRRFCTQLYPEYGAPARTFRSVRPAPETGAPARAA